MQRSQWRSHDREEALKGMWDAEEEGSIVWVELEAFIKSVHPWECCKP